MAFGDNYNDLPMLELAGRPYLMESAAEELRARFPSAAAGWRMCWPGCERPEQNMPPRRFSVPMGPGDAGAAYKRGKEKTKREMGWIKWEAYQKKLPKGQL